MRKIFLVALLLLVIALPVLAAECPANELCNPLGTDKFEVLAERIAGFIVRIGLYAIAPLMIVIGGFQILTAGGNPEGVSAGKKTITYALIGIVILLVAWGLVGLIRDIIGVNATPT